jgi:GNAT superfamily N-acetyltransferase
VRHSSIVSVRRAWPSEIEALVDLCAALFAEDSGRHDPAVDQSWPRREGHTYFSQVIGDDQAVGMVAEVDGAVAGYLVGRLRQPGDTRPVRVAVLEAMYVRPPDRRAGVGAALVREFRAWAGQQMAGRLSVTAYAANVEAIRFYEREGFAPRSLSLEAPA